MVLARSLKDKGTKKQLAVLVTLDSIASSTIDELKVRQAPPTLHNQPLTKIFTDRL